MLAPSAPTLGIQITDIPIGIPLLLKFGSNRIYNYKTQSYNIFTSLSMCPFYFHCNCSVRLN